MTNPLDTKLLDKLVPSSRERRDERLTNLVGSVLGIGIYVLTPLGLIPSISALREGDVATAIGLASATAGFAGGAGALLRFKIFPLYERGQHMLPPRARRAYEQARRELAAVRRLTKAGLDASITEAAEQVAASIDQVAAAYREALLANPAAIAAGLLSDEQERQVAELDREMGESLESLVEVRGIAERYVKATLATSTCTTHVPVTDHAHHVAHASAVTSALEQLAERPATPA